jgi:16S rRNA (adenine1518-N6/adenine1519-N6)-dimethyltransferase
MVDIKAALTKANIEPDPIKGQFFLLDERVVKEMVDMVDLDKRDVVLEIGAGVGNITKELARRAGRVIAYEIDRRYKSLLSGLSGNVELHFADALVSVRAKGKLRRKRVFNKVVSNIPFSMGEPLLHSLIFIEYDRVVLLVPKKLAHKVESNPVFGSFFRVKFGSEVNKSKFYPVPRTNSVIIDLVRLPDPLVSKDLVGFLRQHLYIHERQKVKNALVEGLIRYVGKVYGERLTRNEARTIVSDSGIDEALLDSRPDNPDIYKEVGDKIRGVFSNGVVNLLPGAIRRYNKILEEIDRGEIAGEASSVEELIQQLEKERGGVG